MTVWWSGARTASEVGEGCGGRRGKGFSKRVEEARKCGSEKEIQRDGRGRYYYPLRTADARLARPHHSLISPLSLAPLHAHMQRHRAVRLFYRSSLA